MFRLERGDAGNPDMSADDRSWWLPARVLRDVGGRREDLDASGVLFRLPMMWLAMIAGGGNVIVFYMIITGPRTVDHRLQLVSNSVRSADEQVGKIWKI